MREINDFLKAVQEREKLKRMDMYLGASLTASFVGAVFNGKQIPPIHEVFPEMFVKEQKQIQKERDYQAMMMYKEQMLDFANRHNKARKAKEGENIK